MTRRSIETSSFQHQNPIPVATRIGPLITSGIIPALNPGTRDLPEALEDQIANLFTHMGNALEGAGANWDDMAKVTFFANHPDARALINPHWLEKFPDADSRPSRHTQITPDDRRPTISCDFIAYVDED